MTGTSRVIFLSLDLVLSGIGEQVRHAAHRRHDEEAADFGIAEYRWDAASNLTMLIDPVGNTTHWIYDSLNRVSIEIDLDGQASYTFYDDAGRVSQGRERKGQGKEKRTGTRHSLVLMFHDTDSILH